MKAAIIHEHGGLESVTVDQLPDPEPANSQIILSVRSAALNHLDIWVTKGSPGLKVTMPHVLGSDAAGIVVAAGAGVTDVNIGDEVILNPGISCGTCEFCNTGQQSLCTSFGIVGMTSPGTFAEKVAVQARHVYTKPPYMSFDEAGALTLSYLTAWRMLMTRAALKPGETVLIHGIGGGVALAALQLAKLADAKVIVTSSSDVKLARAGQIGADHKINYNNVDNVAEYVKDITSARGADIVIDTVGADTWPIDFSAVRRGGRIVVCGVTSGPHASIDLRTLYWNQLTILGSTMGSDQDFRQMLKAVTTAKLKPVIDSVMPLETVREAMSKMEMGKQFGKIVLRISQ